MDTVSKMKAQKKVPGEPCSGLSSTRRPPLSKVAGGLGFRIRQAEARPNSGPGQVVRGQEDPAPASPTDPRRPLQLARSRQMDTYDNHTALAVVFRHFSCGLCREVAGFPKPSSDQAPKQCQGGGRQYCWGSGGLERHMHRHSGGLCYSRGGLTASHIHSLDPDLGPVSSFYGWH